MHPLIDEHPDADLRRHRLPGAGHADRAEARRLHARRRRPAPARHGQEEARGDGQAEEHLRRGRAEARACPQEEADRIFGLLEYFAGYGFNKSHSAAYALITYQTAYLKAHYPVELLCAILTSDKDRIEKVVRTIADARAMGVTVLPPDVNESDTDFKVVYTHPAGDRPRQAQREDPATCSARRSASASARCAGSAGRRSRRVFEARGDGPFRDLFDFAARVDAKRVNKARLRGARAVRGVRHDARRSGASRARGRSRRSTSRSSGRARRAAIARPGRPTSSACSTPAPSAAGVAERAATTPSAEPWDRREMLVRERQSLGFYVSGHPLERYVKRRRGPGEGRRQPIAACAKAGRLGGR